MMRRRDFLGACAATVVVPLLPSTSLLTESPFVKVTIGKSGMGHVITFILHRNSQFKFLMRDQEDRDNESLISHKHTHIPIHTLLTIHGVSITKIEDIWEELKGEVIA